MKRSLINRLQGAWQIIRKGSIEPFDKIPFGGSGERMSQPYAQVTWVMRAIKRVANPISAVPLRFSADSREGEVAIENPELTRFWDRPAPGMSLPDFIEATVGWLKMAGEIFYLLPDSWMLPTTTKEPIIVARPDRMRHVVKNGELLYWEFRDGGSRPHRVPPERVVQLKFHNPYDPWRGLGEYAAAEISSQSEYLASKFVLHMMENNGDQGNFVVAKGGMPSAEQQKQIEMALELKRQLRRQGIYKTAFLGGDVEVQDPKVQAADAAFLDGRLQNRHEIFEAFGVPQSMADVVANYSVGSASDRFILIEDTCMPLARKIAEAIEEISVKLINHPVYAWFDWDEHSVMQQVRGERIDSAHKLWTMGMSLEAVNDYLGMGMKPFNGWEVSYLPFSVTPVGTPSPAEDAGFGEVLDLPEFTEEDEELAPVVDALDSLTRALQRTEEFQEARPQQEVALWESHMAQRREVLNAYANGMGRSLMAARNEVLSKIRSMGGNKGLLTRTSALDLIFDLAGFKKGLIGTLRRIALVGIQRAGEQVNAELGSGSSYSFTPSSVLDFLKGRDNHLVGVSNDLFSQIKTSLDEGIKGGETIDELTDRVRAEFNGFSKARAKTVAMTETHAAYGYGRQKAMTDGGVTHKKWLTSGNDNVRPAHAQANGQVVAVDEDFRVGGERLAHPGDEKGSAWNVINCRCVAIPVIQK